MISQASPIVIPADEGVVGPLPPGAHMLFHAHDVTGCRNRAINNYDIGDGFFTPWMNHARRPNAISNISTELTGSNRPLLLFPPVNVAPGAVQSVQFNGFDNTLTAFPFGGPSADFIHQTGVFDLFFAIKPYQNNGTQGDLMGNVDSPSTQNGFTFLIGPGNEVEFHIYNSSVTPTVDLVPFVGIPTGQWNKIFIRGDGSTLFESMNTAFQLLAWVAGGTQAFTGSLNPGTSVNNVVIGNVRGQPGSTQPDATNNFSGEIAEMCLWNRNLSVAELKLVDDFFNDRVRHGLTWI